MIIFTNKTYETIQDSDAFWVFNKSICQRANNGDLTCFPSIEQICKDTGFGRVKVTKALDYLEDKKIIKIQAQIIHKETKQIVRQPRGFKIPKGMNKYEYTSSFYTIIASKEIVSITGKIKIEDDIEGSVPESNRGQYQNRTEVPPKIELRSVPESNSNLQDQYNLQVNTTNKKNKTKKESLDLKFELEKLKSEGYGEKQIEYLENFWEVKKGAKTKLAFDMLIEELNKLNPETKIIALKKAYQGQYRSIEASWFNQSKFLYSPQKNQNMMGAQSSYELSDKIKKIF